MNKQLVIFDFDKTITTKDSLIDFLIFFAGKRKFLQGIIFCFKDLIFYKLKIISNQRAKEILFTYFLKGLTLNEIITAGDIYAEKRLPNILNKKALEKISYHRRNNGRLVIVSASPKYWFEKWARSAGFSDIICTDLEFSSKLFTGKIMGKNCYGLEKVNKLMEIINLEEFDHIIAYGDSRGDKEIIKLADEGYFKYKRVR